VTPAVPTVVTTSQACVNLREQLFRPRNTTPRINRGKPIPSVKRLSLRAEESLSEGVDIEDGAEPPHNSKMKEKTMATASHSKTCSCQMQDVVRHLNANRPSPASIKAP
jgi:hypothetical protein